MKFNKKQQFHLFPKHAVFFFLLYCQGWPCNMFNISNGQQHLTNNIYSCILIFVHHTLGNDCLNRSIGITLLSEVWTSALNNRESIEFKILESKFLSEVSILLPLLSRNLLLSNLFTFEWWFANYWCLSIKCLVIPLFHYWLTY